MATFRTQHTPNPNSMKVTTDAGPFIDEGMASFSTMLEAAGHPLGERLLAIRGVANVFILPDFLTVTREPASDWTDLLATLEAVLTEYFDERAPESDPAS